MLISGFSDGRRKDLQAEPLPEKEEELERILPHICTL
jgi:hypothetical protein